MFKWLTRSMENAQIPLSTAEAADFFSSGPTTAGIPVRHKSALEIPAVWQVVNCVSGDIARLPLDLYRRNGEQRDKDKRHPSYKVVRRRANREAAAFKFWRRFMVHALLWNNAYAFIARRGDGTVAELINLLPDRTHVVRENGRLLYETEVDGQMEPINAHNVLHIEGISTDAIAGHDILQAARDSWALALAQQNFQSKFFANGAMVGGILEVPANVSPKARDTLQEGFTKKTTGVGNWFKTIVLRDNAKFHKTTVSPQDAQLTEVSEESVRQVARWFNVPPSRVGLSDSVSYNSKAEDNRAYVDSTLAVWLEAIASECWLKLLSKPEQDRDTHYFEHNTAALLKLDPLKRHQVYAIGISSGMYSPDEARGMENRPPREDGEGGKYVEPKDTGGINIEKDENPPQRSHDEARVMFSIGARARHKAKNPSAFVEWVDSDLAYHRDEYRQLGLESEAEPDFFSPVLVALRDLLERYSADELPAAVDKTLSRFEGQYVESRDETLSTAG